MHGGFVGVAPAKQSALMNRMKRVDEDVGAATRDTGREAAVAEHGNDVRFRSAGEAGLSQPCR